MAHRPDHQAQDELADPAIQPADPRIPRGEERAGEGPGRSERRGANERQRDASLCGEGGGAFGDQHVAHGYVGPLHGGVGASVRFGVVEAIDLKKKLGEGQQVAANQSLASQVARQHRLRVHPEGVRLEAGLRAQRKKVGGYGKTHIVPAFAQSPSQRKERLYVTTRASRQ